MQVSLSMPTAPSETRRRLGSKSKAPLQRGKAFTKVAKFRKRERGVLHSASKAAKSLGKSKFHPGVSPDRRAQGYNQAMGFRITRGLRAKVGDYQKYCDYTDEIVKRNGGSAGYVEHQTILTEALNAIKSLPLVPTKPEAVHDALRKSSEAVDALYLLMKMENDRLQRQLSLVGGEEVLHDRETQNLRNEVLQMVANREPGAGIPAYQGRRSNHGDAVNFFKDHYKRYTKDGQAVIFAPDLKAIDERLLIALRNQCDGALPLGDRSDRTDAIAAGRFVDAEDSKRQALVSVSHRSRRAKYQTAYS